MRKNISGFTIIELMIVIVVIAVLAAIVLVTYNGISDRANNTKTINAASQWVKALRMMKERTGNYPAPSSCLGTGYKYNSDGLGSSGSAQCYHSGTTTLTQSAAFDTAVASYIEGKPTPAFITAYSGQTNWRRGVYYYNAGATSPALIGIILKGNVDPCPKLGDYDSTARALMGENTVCEYTLGTRDGY